MADDPGGISGLAVGAVAIGGLLLVSAVQNTSPLDTLKLVIGRPSATPKAVSTGFGSAPSGVRGVSGSGAIAVGAAGLAAVAGGNAGDTGRFVGAVRSFLGVPYVYGGTSRSGIDCSGLVIASLRAIGETGIPRFTTVTFDTWAKNRGAKKVDPANFASGDVLRRTGHMAVAISNTRMIHAPHPGTVVKEANIYSPKTWWGWRLF